MSKVVRSASHLPQWFSLASYEPQEDLSLAGWLRQLAVRAELSNFLGGLRVHRPEGVDVRVCPIVPAVAQEEELSFWMAQLDAQLDGRPWGQTPVRHMLLQDLVHAENDVGGDNLAQARVHHTLLCGGGMVTDAERQGSLLYREVDEFASPYATTGKVVVDLALPDEVLKQAFSDLLPSLREVVSGRPGGPVPTNVKMDPTTWIRFSVLPFLDLQQWAIEAGLRIPNRVLADAIFKPGEGGEEVVRKTTAKLAAEVVTDAFLRRLLTAAAEEIRNA